MQISGTMEILALLLTFFVHVAGAAVLILNLRGAGAQSDDAGSWRDWWPHDDAPEPPAPSSPAGDGVAPPRFPDAVPSPVRLREPGHIGDRRAPARRPAHPPVTPERTPAHR